MRVVTEGARGMANPPGRMSEPIAPARDMAAEAARGDAAPAVEAAGRGKRLRLIPDDPYVGWTPYVWLAFLGIYFAAPLSRLRSGDPSPGLLAVDAGGLVAFLFLYFRAYWESGRRLAAIVAAQTLLGAALLPNNFGAIVFFIYAGVFAGHLEPTRHAVIGITAVTATIPLAGIVLGLPAARWLPAIMLVPTIASANVHAVRVRRSQEQLRLAQEEIRHLAAVAERERIARDLHDVLGHTLSLVVLKAQLAAKLIDRDPPRAKGEVRDIESVAREALRDVREAIGGYRASLKDEVARARTLLRAAGVRAEIDADDRLAGGTDRREAVLALALREAVTNVVRHAGANVCRVRIRTRDDVYALEVEDDGRGPGNAEGGGLRGMRERVGALGGHVDVARATPRGGTRVRVTIPAAAAAAARPAEGVAQSSENAVQRTANATRSAAAAGPAANVAGPATDVARPTAEAETA